MNETPTIGLPSYFIKQSKVGGAENQFYNLATGLTQAGAKIIIYCNSKNNLSSDFLRKIEHNSDILIEEEPNYANKSRFYYEQKLIFNKRKIKKLTAIIYPNYFTPLILPQEKPTVVTIIHDLQYKHLPEYFPINKKIWLNFSHRATLRNADKIITISKNALSDIANFYGENHIKKIYTIGNPISWSRFEDTSFPSYLKHGEKYILSVAHHYPHKNIETLIKSFVEIRKKHNVKLILTGQLSSNLNARKNKKKSHTNLLELAQKLQIASEIIFTGYVDDSELGKLYANASVFAFPSLFEGFGMPPVEALGFGVSTITASQAALPEATLGLANYVSNPKDEYEWAEKISDLLCKESFCCVATQQKVRTTYDPQVIGETYLETILR